MARAGWQSTGLRLAAGTEIQIVANGRFTVGRSLLQGKPRRWESEPQGITLQYYQGRPLGMLLGAVEPESLGDSTTRLITPREVGRRTLWRVAETGVLYLQINDAPGGFATVHVRRRTPTDSASPN